MEADRLGDDAEAFVLDPDLPGDRAAAVGPDQVVGADLVLMAVLVVANDRRDRFLVLAQLDQLVIEADPAGR